MASLAAEACPSEKAAGIPLNPGQQCPDNVMAHQRGAPMHTRAL